MTDSYLDFDLAEQFLAQAREAYAAKDKTRLISSLYMMSVALQLPHINGFNPNSALEGTTGC